MGRYKVIALFKPENLGATGLENWINEKYEAGYELIAVTGNYYIFKKNAYFVGVKEFVAEDINTK
jgi:hypothetical protein